MPFIQKTVYSEPTFDYLTYSIDLRGRVLHYVAEIERMIDDYICSHFCYNLKRRTELMEIIVSTRFLTFKDKVDILKYLLLKRKDVSNKEASRIHTVLLQKIAPLRNMIAHCPLDSSMTSINKWKTSPDTVYFTKYKYTKKTESFGKKDFLQFLDLISALRAYLMEIKGKRYQKAKKRKRRTTSRP